MHLEQPLQPADQGTGIVRQLTSFKEYIEEAPIRLKVMCFAGGLTVVMNGLLPVLNVFTFFDHTVSYLLNGFMVFFGIVTCVTELDEDWCGPQVHNWLHARQKWMHDWALGLTMLWGRGLFYIFQGTLALMFSSYFSVGCVLGCYMMITGLLCINQHFSEHKRHTAEAVFYERGAEAERGLHTDGQLRDYLSVGMTHPVANEGYIRVDY